MENEEREMERERKSWCVYEFKCVRVCWCRFARGEWENIEEKSTVMKGWVVCE